MKINNYLKIKQLFSKIDFHFSKKKNLLIFLLLFIGVILPTLSGSESFNFWNKLYNILNNPVYNMLLFISIGINSIYMASEYMKNYNILSRYQNIKIATKQCIKDIIIFTSYLIIISFIIAVAGAVIFSFGDLKMINHQIYNFPIIFYILFFLFRSIIMASIINSIIYLLFLKFDNVITIIIILVNSSLFFLLPGDLSIIDHFYEMHFLYYNYYNIVNYSSFLLEIVVSMIEIIILISINKLLFELLTNKKRDFI